jgi:hypothetical protein
MFRFACIGVALTFSILIQGCSGNDHAVISSTGTLIGLELSQNPTTQTPQGKLGYNRAEFAYVPSNRNQEDDAGNTGQGAKDTAEVLMELKYNDIFSGQSGIYQRLAVGSTAVSQPGAAVMFLRGEDGNVSQSTLDSLNKLK